MLDYMLSFRKFKFLFRLMNDTLSLPHSLPLSLPPCLPPSLHPFLHLE